MASKSLHVNIRMMFFDDRLVNSESRRLIIQTRIYPVELSWVILNKQAMYTNIVSWNMNPGQFRCSDILGTKADYSIVLWKPERHDRSVPKFAPQQKANWG